MPFLPTPQQISGSQCSKEKEKEVSQRQDNPWQLLESCLKILSTWRASTTVPSPHSESMNGLAPACVWWANIPVPIVIDGEAH